MELGSGLCELGLRDLGVRIWGLIVMSQVCLGLKPLSPSMSLPALQGLYTGLNPMP